MKKLVKPVAPWPHISFKAVTLFTDAEGTRGYIPLVHLAVLCEMSDAAMASLLERLGVLTIPPFKDTHYKDGLVNVEDMRRILPEVQDFNPAWRDPNNIEAAIKQFTDRVPNGRRGRPSSGKKERKEKKAKQRKEEEDDADSSSISSVGSPPDDVSMLPGRKRGRKSGQTVIIDVDAEEPPAWAKQFMARIESAVNTCLTMVGAQAVQAYCATDMFREDKKRAVEARMRELEPVMKRALEPKIRAELAEAMAAERSAAIAQGMHNEEVSAMLRVLQQTQQTRLQPFSVVDAAPTEGRRSDSDDELVFSVVSEQRK